MGEIVMRENDIKQLQGMKRYIENLKALAVTNPALAEKRARDMLYRSGVTNKDGTLKAKIVTWD